MTYKEAKANGYKVIDVAWTRKYISRKTNVDEQPVLEAGGKRKGMLFVEVPCWKSTQYSKRLYLAKDGE